MIRPINIHGKGELLYITTGIYSVKVLGGWWVKPANFKITLRNIQTNELIHVKHSLWRIRFFALSTRAVKVFFVDVGITGTYEVIFENSQNVKVRYYGVFPFLWFFKPVPNETIEVCFGC